MPNYKTRETFFVEVNASKKGARAVLEQIRANRKRYLY